MCIIIIIDNLYRGKEDGERGREADADRLDEETLMQVSRQDRHCACRELHSDADHDSEASRGLGRRGRGHAQAG